MAVKKRPVSPRQKMINLMYILLMAMLALNVSSDVLKGFTLMSESLKRTTDKAAEENKNIYEDFQRESGTSDKMRENFAHATEVKKQADELYNLIKNLRIDIAKEADGAEGDPDNLDDKETLSAAENVMLGPTSKKGKTLREKIDQFRQTVNNYVSDPKQKNIVNAILSTEVPKNTEAVGQNWEEYMFEQMPAIAAVTMLTKLQSDVRKAENSALRDLRSNANVQDIRVNDVRAFIIPNKTVFQPGEEFISSVIMAAVDTTNAPEVYVNGQRVSNNYRFKVSTTPGNYTINGYALMPNIFGDIIRREFTQQYTVLPPMVAQKPNDNTTKNPVTNISPHNAPELGAATLAADLMQVLYAGIDNPLSISVSGVDPEHISLTMTGGSLTNKGGGKYSARPAAVGQNCEFTVTGTYKGQTMEFGRFSFRVRKLPDPTAYISHGADRFKGGAVSKGEAIGFSSLSAAIDDGLLDIQFKVTGFDISSVTEAGVTTRVSSSGSGFTDAQRNIFRSLERGQGCEIRNVRCIGPDNVPRVLKQRMGIVIR